MHYTEEQVQQLLKRQRELCAEAYAKASDGWPADIEYKIENAPFPQLEAGKEWDEGYIEPSIRP